MQSQQSHVPPALQVANLMNKYAGYDCLEDASSFAEDPAFGYKENNYMRDYFYADMSLMRDQKIYRQRELQTHYQRRSNFDDFYSPIVQMTMTK